MIKMNPHKKEADRKVVCRVKILMDLLLHVKPLRVKILNFLFVFCEIA